MIKIGDRVRVRDISSTRAHPRYSQLIGRRFDVLDVEGEQDDFCLVTLGVLGTPYEKLLGERLEVVSETTNVKDRQNLPTVSAERKGLPVCSGVLDYFPAALVEVARVSKVGNDKHNPGQELHHARGKSMDHADSIARHLLDRGKIDPDTGLLHSAELAWRALAMLQEELEIEGAPLARGAKLPERFSEDDARADSYQ